VEVKARCPVAIGRFSANGGASGAQPDNLLAWLAEAKPDVACLQELKAAQHALVRTSPAFDGGSTFAAQGRRRGRWTSVIML
jgi:exonuclease III